MLSVDNRTIYNNFLINYGYDIHGEKNKIDKISYG